ncbi:hypothetical protein ANO11243_030110 [Dothideomycetidae sp. 11243]|nr:hypothetical protein ANO11243_030110 [fungal sp. No.11243]
MRHVGTHCNARAVNFEKAAKMMDRDQGRVLVAFVPNRGPLIHRQPLKIAQVGKDAPQLPFPTPLRNDPRTITAAGSGQNHHVRSDEAKKMSEQLMAEWGGRGKKGLTANQQLPVTAGAEREDPQMGRYGPCGASCSLLESRY